MNTMTFKCGSCGTEVTGIVSSLALTAIMERHAKVCPVVTARSMVESWQQATAVHYDPTDGRPLTW